MNNGFRLWVFAHESKKPRNRHISIFPHLPSSGWAATAQRAKWSRGPFWAANALRSRSVRCRYRTPPPKGFAYGWQKFHWSFC